MRRLTLDIDTLRVETFDTDGENERMNGTVLGQQQGTADFTAYPCNQATNNALDFNCYHSIDPEAANCTRVCATSRAVCSTVKGCV